MGLREVQIFKESSDMITFMVSCWTDIAADSIGRKGHFTAALSGGKTPENFFRALSHLADKALWKNTHIFLTDERCVPLDSPDSNYALIRSSLLSKVAIPCENVHPVPVDPNDPAASAKKYEEELRYFFRIEEGPFPEFDLVHLGMGEDGHAASIFPGTDAVREAKRLCTYVILGEKKYDRVTLTLPVINRAENVIFLVSGIEKASVVRRVIEDKDKALPAALVRPKGKLLFLLDRDASLELKSLCPKIR